MDLPNPIPTFNAFHYSSRSWSGTIPVPPTTGDYNAGEVFFQLADVSNEEYERDESYYTQIYKRYWRDFVISRQGDVGVQSTWETFLNNNSDFQQRFKSSFIWAFNKLLDILQYIQEFSVNESTWILDINKTQQKVASAIYQIHFVKPNNADNQFANVVKQRNLQVYSGWQELMNTKVSQFNSSIDATNQSNSTQNSVMTSLIQQMQNMMAQLFSL